MSAILDRIDATLDGLCPCGAPPREGSAYCGDDCVPNWRGRDTVSDLDGTAMRWRPDLPLTDFDDTGMRLLDGDRNGYTGPHNASVYERTPNLWHLRLDDGHRFVGLDMPVTVNDGIINGETVGLMLDAWRRLDRELGDSRRVETYEPWTDALRGWLSPITLRRPSDGTRQRICDWLRANNLDPNDVPDDSPIRVTGDNITVQLIRRGDDGQAVVDGSELVTDLRTVPLAERWPADLYYEHLDADPAAWLPEGPLLDGLVVAQSEATLRRRAGEFTSDRMHWLTYQYLNVPIVNDPRQFLRLATGA